MSSVPAITASFNWCEGGGPELVHGVCFVRFGWQWRKKKTLVLVFMILKVGTKLVFDGEERRAFLLSFAIYGSNGLLNLVMFR